MKLFAVVLAAAAAVAAAADPPAQIHIAYAGNNAGRSDGMSVMWHTTNATATSMAKYGTAPGAYSGTITGSQSTYGFTYDHLAILPGLAPNTTYYYVVGDDAGGWSEEASFLSAPALGRTNTPWKFMAYGDMGVDNSMDTLELAYKKAPENDLVWHVGDISYADDAFLADPLKFGYENRWNEYMQAIEDIASVKPYMVLPGNHEAECHSGFCELDNTLKHKLTNFTAYNNRFRMPSPESGGAENMWYSFNHKNVAFINIDTETDYPNSPNDEYTGLKNGGFGNQIGWLQNALMKANASRAAGQVDWILVAGHRPVYSFNEEDGGVPKGSAKALQAAVEGMFNLYGVDLYMCGHVHSYERQWPTVNNVPVKSYLNPAPPVYIVNGAGGNIEGVTKYGSNPPSWNVVADSIWGLGEMTVHNGTHLQWQFFQGDTQKQVDEFWLVKTTGTHA